MVDVGEVDRDAFYRRNFADLLGPRYEALCAA